ncbi:PREDICTED: box C/D snoRNA protein 1 [Camelina sativa]|uniref:Box C/D snoRNA protein 1 n=1 Tax=Camelina sativa TaxID=90675 RepID=A0ABM0VKF9_CAMSA|nr:PREDICTED: box C/D snoRNA protein 1 [Camelina sativa]
MEGSVCEECKLNPWKYKCPGCSIRSCGLSCVKAHKKRTGCTGKRKLTDFVPLSQFDDNLLLSDYNMLEETKRVAESARRRSSQLCKYPFYNLPHYLRSLRNAAASRRTKLWFAPSGMLKSEKNQSRYDNRTKFISWTIEWRFHSTDVILVDHGVGEDTNLCSVIENHLKPGPWIHKLKPFCDVDLDSLKLFIRLYPKGAKAPFKELNIKAPLRQQLAKLVILEYPVIHVYLPSQSYDFEVIKDFYHANTTPNDNDSLYDGHGSTNGITSRVEEIEEDDIDSFEPKVLDLMKQMNYNPCQRASEEGGVSDNLHPQVDPLEDGDFEFDQELIDTYSDLFAEMNPGDYFNFECEFAKGLDSDDNCDLLNLATDFNIDGLEEGEIVE